jgi:hypothetical protein
MGQPRLFVRCHGAVRLHLTNSLRLFPSGKLPHSAEDHNGDEHGSALAMHSCSRKLLRRFQRHGDTGVIDRTTEKRLMITNHRTVFWGDVERICAS